MDCVFRDTRSGKEYRIEEKHVPRALLEVAGGGWMEADRWVINSCLLGGRDDAVRRGAIILPEGY